MRAIRMFLGLSMVFLFSIPIFAEEGPPDPVTGLIAEMKHRYANLVHMQCRFTKDLVIEGRKVPRTIMLFKFKKKPKTIYLEFLNRFEGRRCLYIEGENDNQIVVRPEGILGLVKFRIDPMGERAMAESTEPIMKMGFGPIIETIEQWHQKSQTDPEATIEFNPDYEKNGVAYFRLYGKAKNNPDFLLILIDRKTFSPYQLEYRYGDSYGLFRYENIEINGGLTDRDFEI